MSYDVWLSTEIDGIEHEVFDVGNYTSNVSPMWRRSLRYSLADLDGVRAEDASASLQIAVGRMRVNPDEYRAMNPENGWGNFEGALAYLERLLEGCRTYPSATVRVSH